LIPQAPGGRIRDLGCGRIAARTLIGGEKDGHSVISERQLDTVSPELGTLAEFERSLIVERTKTGMDAARRRGRHVVRPPSLTTEQVSYARTAINGGESIAGMASVLGVYRNTLKRTLGRDCGYG